MNVRGETVDVSIGAEMFAVGTSVFVHPDSSWARIKGNALVCPHYAVQILHSGTNFSHWQIALPCLLS